MRTIVLRSGLLVAALGLCASPAYAHHSFAMFDMSKNVSYKGVVKEVQWTNPHVWVKMLVEDGGGTKTLDFEAGAIPVLKRAGWQRDSVKPGDKLTIVSHPWKTKRDGGSLERVTFPDGRTVDAGDALPRALLPPGAQ